MTLENLGKRIAAHEVLFRDSGVLSPITLLEPSPERACKTPCFIGESCGL